MSDPIKPGDVHVTAATIARVRALLAGAGGGASPAPSASREGER